VVTNIAPGAEIVRADPGRLQQVLSHLVSNAMRFTPDGGRIVIDGRPAAHDEIHISVTDTGVGIAPEHREAVFEAFQQAGAPASERWPGGTGVGLALAKGLVELHGGRIWLVSRTGHGSTFTIALPHRSDVAPAVEALLQVPQ
jgi:signal transduction histidine kinase